MNKLITIIPLCFLPLSACQPAQNSAIDEPEIVVAFEDYDDWQEWKAEQENNINLPFKPNPIVVAGVGEVRAAPDIAVITGRVKTQAKADYLAMDEAAKITNKIQDQIAGQDVSISFTGVSTIEKRDEECLRDNQIAQRRHYDIINDNRFNAQQLQQPADVRKKLRPPKARIAQKVCPVISVESFVSFTAWVKPAADVQKYLQSFTEAGADNVTLFGYDFSNYDTLYREAADKAVANAREKAEKAASIAGTKLTTIEGFVVTPTSRTTRFGQQAMIISPHGNRYVAQNNITFADRVTRQRMDYAAPAPASSIGIGYGGGMEDEVVVTASRIKPSNYEMATPIVVQEASTYMGWDGSVTERTIPPVLSQDALYKSNAYSGGGGVPTGSNALRQSMMSGAKVIRVEARISFSYDTPINGVVFEIEE